MFFQGADAGFEGEVAVEHEGGGLVLVGGDVAEFAAVPVDADGVAVVGVVGFAMQFDAVADGEVGPEVFAFVVLKAGDVAVLDEVAFAARLGVRAGGQGGEAEALGEAFQKVAADHGHLRGVAGDVRFTRGRAQYLSLARGWGEFL